MFRKHVEPDFHHAQVGAYFFCYSFDCNLLTWDSSCRLESTTVLLLSLGSLSTSSNVKVRSVKYYTSIILFTFQ
ncbi:hypothetical protein Sjap_024814 [Stephania japonica]|uniref:Uncharacterized protein n=1 Tax=Stephania japonica TaxID=461633 RepID=A0AAP0EIZ6_9MAGN